MNGFADPVHHPQKPATTGVSKAGDSARNPPAQPPLVYFRQALSPSDVLALQRTIGNRATERLLNQSQPVEMPKPSPIAISTRQLLIKLLQRVHLTPLPKIKSQWTKGIGVFFDPNCGWYCQVAALEYMIDNRLSDEQRDAIRALYTVEQALPKTTKLGFAPLEEGAKFASKHTDIPTTAKRWWGDVQALGPIVIAGDFALGGLVGHYLLVVGADESTGELELLDPLSVGKVHKRSVDSVMKALNEDTVSYIDLGKLTAFANECVKKVKQQTGKQV